MNCIRSYIWHHGLWLSMHICSLQLKHLISSKFPSTSCHGPGEGFHPFNQEILSSVYAVNSIEVSVLGIWN